MIYTFNSYLTTKHENFLRGKTMENETVIKVVQALVDNNLILIDNGETLSECKLEVRRLQKNNKQEVVLFIIKED